MSTSADKRTSGGLKPYSDRFGSTIPFAEPYWYQGFLSPNFKATHVAFRATVRKFVEEEVKPFIDDWIEEGATYPNELHLKAYAAGINGAIFPARYGGTPPEGYNTFHEMILWDELARVGGGSPMGQLGIDSMALPPILLAGSDYVKDKVARDVIAGRKHISLAISEPGAGSDVANIQTTAELDPTGQFYTVNGSKKWITGGNMADYFTVACRTGDEDSGMTGISLLLLERDMPGIRVRKMKTQFDTTHGTTFINLEDVKVPVRNLIGQEGLGFLYVVENFQHERWVIACSTCRQARLCYELAFQEALTRETFGRPLIKHQLIRFKLAEMARQIESLYALIETTAFQFQAGVKDFSMGQQCALLKVQASKTFEYCSREASQIFGGSSIVREGRGMLVERMAREVRAAAIPGGSEEILLDFAIRSAVQTHEKTQRSIAKL